MLSLRLPPKIERRLGSLAKNTGRTKSFYVREAIIEHLDDLEDIHIAERRIEDIRSGRAKTLTLDEVERRHGLR